MPLIESTPYDPNGIIVGDYPQQTAGATIGSGTNLTAGAVLGRITASGNYIRSASGASDGSQTPVAILLTDAAAASTAQPAIILLSGEVDAAKLNFGAGHTAASVETAFRSAGRPLFLRNVTPA